MSDNIQVATNEDVTKVESVNLQQGTQTQEQTNVDNNQQKTKEEQERELKGIAKIQANYDKLHAESQRQQEEIKRLLKVVDEERKKNLSQKEREDLEKQEKERENQRLAIELEGKTLAFEKSKYLFKNEFDDDYLEMIAGNTLDAFKDNIDKLNEKIAKLVEKKVNEKLALANVIPSSGTNNNSEYFSIEEVNTLPKKMGAEWTKQNLDKIQKSIAYHNKK